MRLGCDVGPLHASTAQDPSDCHGETTSPLNQETRTDPGLGATSAAWTRTRGPRAFWPQLAPAISFQIPTSDTHIFRLSSGRRPWGRPVQAARAVMRPCPNVRIQSFSGLLARTHRQSHKQYIGRSRARARGRSLARNAWAAAIAQSRRLGRESFKTP